MQTALGGYQSIRELVGPGGRLHESRKAIIDGVARSHYLYLTPPRGAMYAFIGVQTERLPEFDDQRFAMDLLEHKHVLVAPGIELQRAVPDAFPDHQPAGSCRARGRVRAHRGTARQLCRRRPARVAPDAAARRRERTR